MGVNPCQAKTLCRYFWMKGCKGVRNLCAHTEVDVNRGVPVEDLLMIL